MVLDFLVVKNPEKIQLPDFGYADLVGVGRLASPAKMHTFRSLQNDGVKWGLVKNRVLKDDFQKQEIPMCRGST